MTTEQILVRQEVRQMLNEAGINKNTLKDMVKDILIEEVAKAGKQAVNETNVDELVNRKVSENFRRIAKEVVREKFAYVFSKMSVEIKFVDEKGQESTTYM